MQAPSLSDALSLATAGFRVLPLSPGTKVPALRHWPDKASSSPEAVRAYWRPESNIGICTGNGLAVVDVDPDHGGVAPDWLPSTLTAVTPSGGLHFYLAVDRWVPCSVSRIAPGVDVRGERGQVAAPPSVTDAGCYRWAADRANDCITQVDADLLIPEDLKHDYTGTRRRFEYRDSVPVGERNHYLTALAGYLYALGESYSEVLEALEQEAQALDFAPSRPDEITKIAKSVARYHAA